MVVVVAAVAAAEYGETRKRPSRRLCLPMDDDGALRGMGSKADSAIRGARKKAVLDMCRRAGSGLRVFWIKKRCAERKGRMDLTMSELEVNPPAWVPPSITLDDNISWGICC